MKALFYVKKEKPYLADFKGEYQTYSNAKELDELWDKGFNVNDIMNILNGKIVAECEFEVEKINVVENPDYAGSDNYYFIADVLADMQTKTLSEAQLLERSCLSQERLYAYLDRGGVIEDYGYATHIKNLNVFDEPRELSDVYKIENVGGMLFTKLLTNVPHNMMRVSINHWDYATYNRDDIRILIPITSQEACNILNHKQDVLVRRNVLKEMLKNE